MSSTSTSDSFTTTVIAEGKKLNGQVAIGHNSKYAHIMRKYTTHMLIVTACGARINALTMSREEAEQNGHEMCTRCIAANTPKVIAIKVACADCGDSNSSKSSIYCTYCRANHAHKFVKAAPDARLEGVVCNVCGETRDSTKHSEGK